MEADSSTVPVKPIVGKLAAMLFQAVVRSAAFNIMQLSSIENHEIPLRILFWYEDPLSLKEDVSRILKYVVERPFLCLNKELFERAEWRDIVICLALPPSMFVNTRALLHKWLLLTGLASVHEFLAGLISAIVYIISRPVWLGIPMELASLLPFSLMHTFLANTALEIQQNPGLMTYFALTLLLILPNPSACYPLPSQCELYSVNRDTLFSCHKDSESFLQANRMMALCVSSHYMNSPNDIQLLADAPAHYFFVLLGPVDESQNKLPDILCVVQICLEGQISKNSALQSLRDGHSPYGDQIPWKFCEQFRDIEFPNLSGARIVRIAVHPNAMKMGYGSAAVELLTRYFEGQIAPISEADEKVDVEHSPIRVAEAAEKVSMLEEQVKPRTNLPPLLVALHERRPERLHYIGVSFGLTLDLFRFWRKHNFAPFYSAVTGEHTCMLLKPLKNDELEVSGSDELGFFAPFYKDFRMRFSKLLSDKFKKMDYTLAMSVLNPKINFQGNSSDGFFKTLDGIYTTILGIAGVGFSSIELERGHIHSLLLKVTQELYKYLNGIASEEIEPSLPILKERVLEPHNVSVDDDLREGAKQVEEQMNKKKKKKGSIDSELEQYVIGDEEAEALQHSKIFSSDSHKRMAGIVPTIEKARLYGGWKRWRTCLIPSLRI
ncbi:unnamed protein product [Microthlaspi erraticum]|uniref:N-acetyltransferase domain-containing protein n=1 Tax=Microthlaspi erraticum TaxID=1685480 RepID=A0A6D2KXW5_9BRAS|nr:unnamed protein product [Microthlaspi erraticum]